jgi:signal transduction histidine kinase
MAIAWLDVARETNDSKSLATVAEAHTRMERLIDDLLTLAQSGEDVTDPYPVSLPTLAEGCWRNVDTTGATLVVDATVTVLAAGSRLEQLLENLLRNAVEHGDGGVTVTVGDLPGETGFYVADDGPGIPIEEREAVLEWGYSGTEWGTGFGLAIVSEVAESHGWTLRLTESVAGGARFEFDDVTVLE